MSRMNVRVVNLDTELMPVGAAQALTVSTVALTPAALPANATHGRVDVGSADVRWTDEGTAPVGGTTGGLLLNGGTMTRRKEVIEALKLIRNDAVDATVLVTPLTIR